MHIFRSVALIICGSIAFASPALAQSLGNVAWGSVQAGQDEAIRTNRNVSAQVITGRISSVPKKPDLTFKASSSRTRQNLKALADNMRKADPAVAAQMEQLFASTDIIGAVGGVMDRYGLQRNNVAHAYALYWVVYWGLANKVYNAPSAAKMRAVAAQAELGFSGNAQFVSMNDTQKQAAAEELMALAAILDATSEQAKTDPALAEQAATASLEGSRKSGLDLDKMTLTEDGFVPAKPRKKADASDAVGDDATALASADTGGTDAAPNYILFAALGSATLGGMYWVGKTVGRKG